MGGTPVGFCYNSRQLLEAKNKYNKAALLPTTLDEYKQVLYRIFPEGLTKYLPRSNRNTWTNLRTG